jgi:hypothetical protein
MFQAARHHVLYCTARTIFYLAGSMYDTLTDLRTLLCSIHRSDYIITAADPRNMVNVDRPARRVSEVGSCSVGDDVLFHAGRWRTSG